MQQLYRQDADKAIEEDGHFRHFADNSFVPWKNIGILRGCDGEKIGGLVAVLGIGEGIRGAAFDAAIGGRQRLRRFGLARRWYTGDLA